MKTRVVDNSGGCQHIRDCADESGVDYLSYQSCERKQVIKGVTVESWYDEDASHPLWAWKAFVMGVGTGSGASREEAIDDILGRVTK